MTKKKSQAIPNMVKGLISQLVTQVTYSPRGFLPTFLMLAKSTFIIMGKIISQIRTAMGIETFSYSSCDNNEGISGMN